MGTQGVRLNSWIPACAEMTGFPLPSRAVIPLDSRVRENDRFNDGAVVSCRPGFPRARE